MILSLLPGCYFTDLAAGQLRLLNDQTPLPKAMERETDPERRAMLKLVPSVRAFARDVMQLRPGDNYTGYHALEGEGVTHTVVGSERTRLEPYTWWFPVAGAVPYKGFFDEADARAEARELEREGYDVWVGHARAYSTLGFFRDPVLTTMMEDGPTSFVEVLLHEMAHGRFYVAGQTDFNEQLASFVGRRGLRQFLRAHLGDSPGLIAALDAREARSERRDALVQESLETLETLYTSDASKPAVLRERRIHFAALERQLRALYPDRPDEDFSINNARLLQFRRYLARTDLFERIWAAAGSWPRFWNAVERHASAAF